MNSQHKRNPSVLAPHPRVTAARLEATCLEANNRLTPAFLRTALHLSKDPEPRFSWVNRRRTSNAPAAPSIEIVHLAQRALCDAVLSGDRDQMEKTAIEVQSLCEEMLAAMLAPYHTAVNGETTITASALAAHKEVSEAAHAIAIALVTKSPGDVERAVRESKEADVALDAFRDTARQQVHTAAVRALR